MHVVGEGWGALLGAWLSIEWCVGLHHPVCPLPQRHGLCLCSSSLGSVQSCIPLLLGGQTLLCHAPVVLWPDARRAASPEVQHLARAAYASAMLPPLSAIDVSSERDVRVCDHYYCVIVLMMTCRVARRKLNDYCRLQVTCCAIDNRHLLCGAPARAVRYY